MRVRRGSIADLGALCALSCHILLREHDARVANKEGPQLVPKIAAEDKEAQQQDDAADNAGANRVTAKERNLRRDRASSSRSGWGTRTGRGRWYSASDQPLAVARIGRWLPTRSA